MPSFRFGGILAIALAFLVGTTLVARVPAEAHGANVKISEDGSGQSHRYWDGTPNHTAPFYTDVTVHSDGAVTFWGTTVCNGTIVYSDGALNAYYNYQRIPIDVSNPIAQRNFASANNPGSGMHYSAERSNCPQVARAPFKPAVKPPLRYQYIGTNTAVGSYSFLDSTNNTLYVFPASAAAIKTDAQSHFIGVQVGNLMFPLVASGGGNILLNGCCNLVASGGGNFSFRSPAGGTIVASGGGNLVASGGGNLIGNDGSSLVRAMQNLVASGGGNLVGTSGGTLIGNASGTLIGNASGTLVSDSGGTFSLMSMYSGSLSPAIIQQCDDNRISVAFALSGLVAPYALNRGDSGKAGKCSPSLYLGAGYVVAGDANGTRTVQSLVQVIKASINCYPSHPWIGEALWQTGIQRQAFAGSCSVATYTVDGPIVSYADLVNRVKARYLVAQRGVPAQPVDKYGCTSPNYGIAMFPGNVFEPETTPNLNTNLAISFRCSNQVPAGYTRPYPIPANLLFAVAQPPAAIVGPALPISCPNNNAAAALYASVPGYFFWANTANLDLSKATRVVCYNQLPAGLRLQFNVPPNLALTKPAPDQWGCPANDPAYAVFPLPSGGITESDPANTPNIDLSQATMIVCKSLLQSKAPAGNYIPQVPSARFMK